METPAKTTKGYIETVGRRKTSVARVRISDASKMSYTINDKEIEVYFPVKELQNVVMNAHAKAGIEAKFKITAKLNGGGISSQAVALQHGIARALVKYDENLRRKLKDEGLLKRDARAKERRKFGLKKARKAPQWSKR